MNQTKNISNAPLQKQNPSNLIFFQPKLTINQPNDIYEQEADAIAERVMRMPAESDTFFKPAVNFIQRKCAHCEEEGKKLQMKGTGDAPGHMKAPSVVNDVVNSTGHSLDANTKNFMQSRFGHDFGNVQIHDDSLAHQSAQEINAVAYTHSNHIVFQSGQYQPSTNSGKQLLAHELVHVMQQKKAERFPRGNIAAVVQKKDGQTKCTPPTSVELGKTEAIAYADFLTGTNSAGICAVMKTYPENEDLCPDSIKEEVTSDKQTSCPTTLVSGGCTGDSVFSFGKKGKLCDMPITASEFIDRHSMQVQTVSVLHDRKRNLKNLKSCKFVCNQKYFNVDSKNNLGNFQIIFELTRAKHDKKNVTDVKASKKKVP